VIPTVLLVGLIFGRWWKITIPAAVLAWPALLIATGIGSGVRFAFDAALFAAGNIVAGVITYQAIRLIARRVTAFARHLTSDS
jgi:hypothetical protein